MIQLVAEMEDLQSEQDESLRVFGWRLWIKRPTVSLISRKAYCAKEISFCGDKTAARRFLKIFKKLVEAIFPSCR